MGEKQYSLESPQSSPIKSINGTQKAILAIFIIFTLVFVGYYFFLFPYQDNSDLFYDSVELDPELSNFIPTTTDEFSDYGHFVDIFDEGIQHSKEFEDLDDIFYADYIETTASPKESTFESEEFLNYDNSDKINYPEGSGDDDDLIEIEDDVPNCSKSFKIPEFNKIICLVEAPKTPEGAAKYCKSHQMKLLKITDNKMKQKVFDGSRKIFGVGGGTALWIDGKWNEDDQIWESWNDDLDVKVHPSENMLGECSRIFSPLNQKYEISSSKCELTYYFYCEKLIQE